jgi:hypothetical protein
VLFLEDHHHLKELPMPRHASDDEREDRGASGGLPPWLFVTLVALGVLLAGGAVVGAAIFALTTFPKGSPAVEKPNTPAAQTRQEPEPSATREPAPELPWAHDEMPLKTYAGIPAGTGLRTHTYAEFADGYAFGPPAFVGTYYCVRLTQTDPPQELWGFVQKDSPAGRKLFGVLKDGRRHLVHVFISWNTDEKIWGVRIGEVLD